MATTKVTFTLDDETLSRLAKASDRLARPKSEIVRQAIRDFSERAGRLGEPERVKLLAIFDRVVPAIAPRASGEVAHELAELRRSRRAASRRTTRSTPRR